MSGLKCANHPKGRLDMRYSLGGISDKIDAIKYILKETRRASQKQRNIQMISVEAKSPDTVKPKYLET